MSGRILEIMAAITRERQFQDAKYGPVLEQDPESRILSQVQGRGGHELGSWLIIIEKELDEAKDAAIHGGMKGRTGRNTVRAELVQIAAVCVAALEQHGLEETA